MHQPHFLPWLPYLSRILSADTFVVLDDVPFRHSYFQNRTLVRNREGDIDWITLPIDHSTSSQIKSCRLKHPSCLRKAREKLFHYYRRALHFDEVWTWLEPVFHSLEGGLLEINLGFLQTVAEALDLPFPKLAYSSELLRSKDRTDRIVEAMRAMKCSTFLAGGGQSAAVHDLRKIRSVGLQFLNTHPERILSLLPKGFRQTGLSIVDPLFHLGSVQLGLVLRQAIARHQEIPSSYAS